MNLNLPDNHDPEFQKWLVEKRHTAVPDGFSDRVLDRLRPHPFPMAPSWRSFTFWAKAAVLTLALTGGLARYALLFACLFTR